MPTAAQVDSGEIAVNLSDRKIYSKKTDGTVVALGRSSIADSTDVKGSVTPANGQLLAWNSTESLWIPTTFQSPVASVNSLTGAVSLGLQELDDFALNTTPWSGGFRYSKSADTTMSNGEWIPWNYPTNKHLQISRYDAEGIDRYTYLNSKTGSNFSGKIWISSDAGVTYTLWNQWTSFAWSANGYFIAWLPNTVAPPSYSGDIRVSFEEPGVAQPVSLAIGDYIRYDGTKFKPQQLSTVAVSGSYNDLTNKPSLSFSIDSLTDVNTSSPAPGDGQLLKWTASSSNWTPVSPRPHVLRRIATSVSGSVAIDSSKDYQTLIWTGASPQAVFSAGTEGAEVELVNRSTASLQLSANSVTLKTPSGWLYLRPGGAATAIYANSVWNITGDIHDPGINDPFYLEDAQDYSEAATKSNGDFMVWNGSTAFTTRPLAWGNISGLIESNLSLGLLSNVTQSSNTDKQYLRYNATSSQWEGVQLPLDEIAEDVQLRTDLGELANVVITSPSNNDIIVYSSSSGSWVNAPGGSDNAKADKLSTILSIAGNYTVQAIDSAKVIEVAGASRITLPDTVSIGFQVVIIRIGSSEVEIAATTLLTAGARNFLNEQYSAATCIHKGAGVWYVFGDLKTQP